MSKERWKPIQGYEGLYEVSNEGRVRKADGSPVNLIKHRIRKKHAVYVVVNLRKNNSRSSPLVHRLVADAFLPNHTNKRYVLHKDMNTLNNSLSNLVRMTAAERRSFLIRGGFYIPHGENISTGRVKLKEKDVIFIRKRYAEGGITQKSLALRFSVTDVAIMKIIKRQTWKHVK